MLSRMGNDSPEYREVSAKMLGTCLHMLQGTPYIFQGEELGMTNYPFASLDEFRDIESIHAYQEFTEKGIISPDEMFQYICYKGRDNARTPMQWDDSGQAGFTTGTPWIGVNPNYKEINAKEQMGRPDSVFCYYQKLIALRRQYDIIVYGDYELLLPESEEIYAYLRTYGEEKLLTVCNFTDREVVFESPDDLKGRNGRILISNYNREENQDTITLAAYECMAVYYGN